MSIYDEAREAAGERLLDIRDDREIWHQIINPALEAIELSASPEKLTEQTHAVVAVFGQEIMRLHRKINKLGSDLEFARKETRLLAQRLDRQGVVSIDELRADEVEEVTGFRP